MECAKMRNCSIKNRNLFNRNFLAEKFLLSKGHLRPFEGQIDGKAKFAMESKLGVDLWLDGWFESAPLKTDPIQCT